MWDLLNSVSQLTRSSKGPILLDITSLLTTTLLSAGMYIQKALETPLYPNRIPFSAVGLKFILFCEGT
jgi:hypothetical protein